ncbi:MAG: phospholipase D-like domain-containing protein, partial [Actinomycetaceae bacterium]|nr:phospholipase D-like domain-containing protein [Actinomycetaceae bacterium]
MNRLTRDTTSTALRVARLIITLLLSAQALAIALLVSIDTVRKFRRTQHSDGYPVIEPEPFQAAGNNMTIYMEGVSVYADMLVEIERAKHFIYFETYIWKDDAIGHMFKDALIRAAQRGVNVYIVWDAFGNMVVKPKFFVFPVLPHLHPMRYPLPHTGRDHRKILVVDGKTGFVGGYNIGDLYASLEWRDTHIKIEGAAVWELENAFVDFWNRARNQWYNRLHNAVTRVLSRSKPQYPKLPDQGAKQWDASIVAAINDPKRLVFPIRGSYIDILERAVDRAYLTAAYFVPDREIQGSLIAAAQRGVDVRVLIPEKSNHIVADWISRAYLTELLDAGIQLWRYKDLMIHSKTAVVDGRWTTIGTANIDRMSMTGNHEINLEIFDETAAKKMEDVFLTDLKNARRLTVEEWYDRPYIARIIESIL